MLQRKRRHTTASPLKRRSLPSLRHQLAQLGGKTRSDRSWQGWIQTLLCGIETHWCSEPGLSLSSSSERVVDSSYPLASHAGSNTVAPAVTSQGPAQVCGLYNSSAVIEAGIYRTVSLPCYAIVDVPLITRVMLSCRRKAWWCKMRSSHASALLHPVRFHPLRRAQCSIPHLEECSLQA
jgi:hypothetical protein